ncbi:hypothetical protein BC835DRAFT_1416690 [Cytidiella melzeri]|nr:hypothetical protein BC835DRAFT_1416690 [Cytidiella melzeri]
MSHAFGASGRVTTQLAPALPLLDFAFRLNLLEVILFLIMAGRKRAADTDAEGPTTRSKVAKVGGTSPPKPKGGKKGPKAKFSTAGFKSRALPLHVNLTHTPPVIGGDDTKDLAQADPGFIGSIALVPSTFNTGSYGWKGNKRITVELLNAESGGKEEVQVMLTINATVLGSKNAEDDAADDGEKDAGEAATAQAEGDEAEKEVIAEDTE